LRQHAHAGVIQRFIEYNWNLGTIGDPQSFDVLSSGSILGMFDFVDFQSPESRMLILSPSTGQPVGSGAGNSDFRSK
jgi:hypothetical protein